MFALFRLHSREPPGPVATAPPGRKRKPVHGAAVRERLGLHASAGPTLSGPSVGSSKRPKAKGRNARTEGVALARINDANIQLLARGHRPLCGSTVWCSTREIFVHNCVCGSALAVNQTKDLVKHGEKCKGQVPDGLGALVAPQPLGAPSPCLGGAGQPSVVVEHSLEVSLEGLGDEGGDCAIGDGVSAGFDSDGDPAAQYQQCRCQQQRRTLRLSLATRGNRLMLWMWQRCRSLPFEVLRKAPPCVVFVWMETVLPIALCAVSP